MPIQSSERLILISFFVRYLLINSPIIDPIVVADEDFTDGTTTCLASFIGRFWWKQEVNVRFLKPAMQKAWKTSAFKLVPLRSNTYQIFFDVSIEGQWVLDNGPWTFDDTLFVLRLWTRESHTSDEVFNSEKFWLHIRGVPRECITLAVRQKIGALFPHWQFLQIREYTDIHEKYFHMLVQICLDSPLPRGTLPNVPHYGCCPLAFQYERLPHFCFNCGFINHTITHCPLAPEE